MNELFPRIFTSLKALPSSFYNEFQAFIPREGVTFSASGFGFDKVLPKLVWKNSGRSNVGQIGPQKNIIYFSVLLLIVAFDV